MQSSSPYVPYHGRGRQPMLGREAEFDLARRWRDRGDEKALHRLILAYTPLVGNMARRFRSYGLSEEDLQQEGQLGLLQAARKFDPELGIRFGTYASWWVRAAVQEFVFRNYSLVGAKATTVGKRLFFQCRTVYNRVEALNPTWGRSQIVARVAELLGVTADQVAQMAERLACPTYSLDVPIAVIAGVSDDGETTFGDNLPSPDPLPDEVVEKTLDGGQLSKKLRTAIYDLSDRQQVIIKARWLSDEMATLDELGTQFAVSKERIRQVEKDAFGYLQNRLLGRRSRLPDRRKRCAA
ncbi:sigma-70 family RNA polymerase sigma factor [Mesorhizobium silamurunense]|uniref:sigma-70 family RNA polymerase sigma factor n=1 Tax=Mesorhizobium silamurunense TaxID=499528 RepID=UPI00178480D1|nr:sigma-70 family RNA polymerase sigma factor [Mesorhizobium silamurunense]